MVSHSTTPENWKEWLRVPLKPGPPEVTSTSSIRCCKLGLTVVRD